MIAKWWFGALTALALCAAAAPAEAQSRGRLIFLNPTNGNFLTGTVDVAGFFHFAETGQNLPRLIGTTKLVATDSGLLAYALNSGSTTTILLDSLATAFFVSKPNFSPNWLIIASYGNYLFLTSGSGTGAIVFVAPDGTIKQTWNSNKLSLWSHVVATDNYLFFYNRPNGVFAEGAIVADGGAFFQEDGGSGVPTGFTLVTSVGDNLLLYNAFTGAYETAGIFFAGNGKDFFDRRSNGKLPLGFAQAVALDRHLLLYNPTNGATLIGNFDRTGAFVTTQSLTTKAGWTNVVASGDYLLFYSATTGSFQIYALTTNGKLAKTSSAVLGAGYSLVTGTRQ